MTNKIFKISIIGAPGSGKGTQAGMLSQRLNVPTISVGQLWRQEMKKKSDASQKAAEFVERGELAPNHLTNEILYERLKKDDTQNGFIIDGFPRSRIQAKFFAETNGQFTHAIFIHISDEEVVTRISGRRYCECGATYHIKFEPPQKENICDECGKKLTVREDDRLEVIRRRLKIYHSETEPVVEYFSEQNILHKINGQRPVAQVHLAIANIFRAK
jgi:adenylate kinase